MTGKVASVSLLGLAGCAVGPDFLVPQALVERAWLTPIASGAAPAGTIDAREFWSEFHDRTLLKMIAMADARSLTLQTAAETVKQAQGQIRIDRANLFPTVQSTVGSTYAQPTIAGELKNQNLGATTDQSLGQLSWELDFWGQVRRQIEGDSANLKASEYAYAAAKVSLEASVATTYINLRMAERMIQVDEENLKDQAENKRVAFAKAQSGLNSQLDYSQSNTQYEQTNSQLPALRQSLMQDQHALGVLIGETPDYFARHEKADAGLPAVPRWLPVGAPKDLLRRRPDVLQDELNAAAQSARIGVAEAALYPSFSLTGEFGYSNTGIVAQTFMWQNRVIQAGGNLVMPIFDRDRLVAQVDVQDNVFRQAVLTYQNQVLSAQQDVEDSLAEVKEQTELVADDKRADDAAAETTALSLTQYNAGQADFTTVSSAAATRQQTSIALVQAQGGLLQAYVSAFRALGGGWEPGAKPQQVAETGGRP
jgi:NodT family efflux transporter outer membrane factor (OMF) lipoprotein